MTDEKSDIPPWHQAPLSAQVQHRLDKSYPVFGTGGLALFGPHKFVATADASPYLQKFRSAQVYEDDVWVVSLPKCGTTWMQELVWLLTHNCDYSSAQCLLCPDRYHFLELPIITSPSDRQAIECGSSVTSRRQMEPLENRSRPRHIKTHLPLNMCPSALLDKAKVIYISRNPKDMCVSYYHHLELFDERDPNLTLDDFVDMFIEGHVMEMPYFPHVLEAWRHRHRDNLLFVFYEDMKADLRKCINAVADFLNKPITEEQLEKLEIHLSFENMKNNKWTNKSMLSAYLPYVPDNENCEDLVHDREIEPKKSSQVVLENSASPQFMRVGKVGDWKNHISALKASRMDQWIAQETKDTDFSIKMS